jgi:hypothetical protein
MRGPAAGSSVRAAVLAARGAGLLHETALRSSWKWNAEPTPTAKGRYWITPDRPAVGPEFLSPPPFSSCLKEGT